MKEKILVTGASGTVGQQVVKQLLTKGQYEITVFDVETPKTTKVLSKFSDKVRIVYGDITKREEIEKAVLGQEKIIHLAAIIPPLADEKPDLARAVNIGGTQNILEVMSEDTFLMYASSVSVYGDRVDSPMIKISDELRPSPRDKYAETKIATEKLVRETAKKWTIFRLSAIMGYGNHKISPIMFHMPLNTSVEITTPEDTARAFVNGLEFESQLLGNIFNLGGGEKNRTTYEEFLQSSFNAFGLGKLNFPPKTFAEKNFHCGYYADGDHLEEIVHFRQDTLDTYFEKVRASVSPVKKFFASLLKDIIKYFLLQKSEPYKAYKEQDREEIEQYFGKK